MKTDRDLEYRLYIQKNDGFTRNPFNREMETYKVIQSGNVEQAKKDFEQRRQNFLEGKGKLSDDPVRNVMYHLVTAVALVARFCVEGGLGHDAAYTLSDIYIQRADKCRSCDEVLDIFEEMLLDFAGRMRDLKKENVISLHVRKCIDYIYDHLGDRLLLSDLAEYTGLNSSYLSKLFAQETGTTFKEFVLNAKVTTAENLLRYSDFPSSEIALALGFSSQSAFISTFRKKVGVTPRAYRQKSTAMDSAT